MFDFWVADLDFFLPFFFFFDCVQILNLGVMNAELSFQLTGEYLNNILFVSSFLSSFLSSQVILIPCYCIKCCHESTQSYCQAEKQPSFLSGIVEASCCSQQEVH